MDFLLFVPGYNPHDTPLLFLSVCPRSLLIVMEYLFPLLQQQID